MLKHDLLALPFFFESSMLSLGTGLLQNAELGLYQSEKTRSGFSL
jgi:hypothetical protein